MAKNNLCLLSIKIEADFDIHWADSVSDGDSGLFIL